MGPRNDIVFGEKIQGLAQGNGYFRCVALRCTLDERSCALRFSRGQDLKKHYPQGVPADVQTYLVCRDCGVGKSHYTTLRKKGTL